MKLNEYVKVLEGKIQSSYEEGVTMENAEKLAAEFLRAMMLVSAELRTMDLDARMRKSGVKAVKAKAYLDIVTSQEKKPTETHIQSLIDTNGVVSEAQDNLDVAEVDKAELERYYDIFQNAHVYYRNVSKGKFD